MAAAAVIAAVGATVGAMGSIHQGNAAAAAAEHNAAMARANAGQASAAAAEQERRFRINTKKQIGQARANYGASGVTLEGSPMDMLEESARNAELDALTIRHAGEQKAWAFNNQAALDVYEGRNARVGGTFNAVSTLLLGATRALSYGGGSSGGGGGAATAPTAASSAGGK